VNFILYHIICIIPFSVQKVNADGKKTDKRKSGGKAQFQILIYRDVRHGYEAKPIESFCVAFGFKSDR
jgi:hypothetical protein